LPSAHLALLAAGELAAAPPPQVAILGELDDPRTRALLAEVHRRRGLRPLVQAASPGTEDADLPLLSGKSPLSAEPTAFVCRDYACRAPTTDPAQLRRQLEAGQKDGPA
jgi:uncharacterized protein YyaL (SSP411 family)